MNTDLHGRCWEFILKPPSGSPRRKLRLAATYTIAPNPQAAVRLVRTEAAPDRFEVEPYDYWSLQTHTEIDDALRREDRQRNCSGQAQLPSGRAGRRLGIDKMSAVAARRSFRRDEPDGG